MALSITILYTLACINLIASAIMLGISFWTLKDADKQLASCKKLLEEIETTTNEITTKAGEYHDSQQHQ